MWKDSETKVDFLDFEYLKEILKDIIKNDNLTPSTIGVYGDWGSGKSSLIEMVMEELEKEDGILCIKFNGWLFEGYEDAKTSFMGVILDEISDKKKIEGSIKGTLTQLYRNIDLLKLASFGMKHGMDYFLTGGTGTFLNILTAQIKKKISEVSESDISNVLAETMSPQKLRQSISEFRKEFGKFLQESDIKRLVIFIDELDRCSSETILETFEAMRLFLFTENTSFIIGADERHIEYAVRQKFKEIEGNNINIGKEYLEKIIQYPVKIPQLGKREMINYIIYLFLQNELTLPEFQEFSEIIRKEKRELDFEIDYAFIDEYYPAIRDKAKEPIYLAKTIGPILAKGLNGNPRHCKRFLNALSMRKKMGKYKGVKLERKILAKLMILEYFNQSYFKELSGFVDKEGKIKELAEFEKESMIDENRLEILKKYKDDESFKDWANLDPEIFDIDIRPYLYFTRDTLHNFGTMNYRLSETGKEILEDILSGSETKEKKWLSRLSEITPSEGDFIYDELIKNILADGEILNNKKFQRLIKYCSIRKEKKESFIIFLKGIPGIRINFATIPYLKNYFEKENLINEGKGIFNKWSQENTKLKNAIDKQLKSLDGGN